MVEPEIQHQRLAVLRNRSGGLPPLLNQALLNDLAQHSHGEASTQGRIHAVVGRVCQGVHCIQIGRSCDKVEDVLLVLWDGSLCLLDGHAQPCCSSPHREETLTERLLLRGRVAEELVNLADDLILRQEAVADDTDITASLHAQEALQLISTACASQSAIEHLAFLPKTTCLRVLDQRWARVRIIGSLIVAAIIFGNEDSNVQNRAWFPFAAYDHSQLECTPRTAKGCRTFVKDNQDTPGPSESPAETAAAWIKRDVPGQFMLVVAIGTHPEDSSMASLVGKFLQAEHEVHHGFTPPVADKPLRALLTFMGRD
mmetsp:Transcript_111058/g.287148  ORF Transcript_111058/g.287148 Transcript_111058/m.287148 type:complete len:313 (+) Transcript_111058:616-1554(+)